MEIILEWMRSLLGSLGIATDEPDLFNRLVVLTSILIIAYLADVICRHVILRAIKQITLRTKVTWDDLLFNDKVMNSLCHIIPPVVIYTLIPLVFSHSPEVLSFIYKLCLVCILAVSLKFVNNFLKVVFELSNQKREFRDRPLKGIYQVIQVGLFFVGTIAIISILIDKSPATLFAGLGASAAVLMLVFKDSIMGLVSGIQLSANDMLRPGDWITMPKYNADGTVIEVTLNTVKVRNFDNTITTIPPYALVSDSFQNWRGMQESGGRRVKRSISIDMNSVRFCTPQMLEKYKKIEVLKGYIEQTEREVEAYNLEHCIDNSILVNGHRQTNLGAFRAYLTRYLQTIPATNKEMTCMVRHLQPTEKGIPIELYFFSQEKEWVQYETIQADVFDHVLAIVPEFDLQVYQSPSGADFTRTLGKTN